MPPATAFGSKGRAGASAIWIYLYNALIRRVFLLTQVDFLRQPKIALCFNMRTEIKMAANWLDYFTLNNIGFVIGVFGFLFSIYTYLRTRERRAIIYKKAETKIIGGNGSKILDGKIEIRFSGRVIERVTKTTFWVWNGGNRTISAEDIAQGDRLRFVIPSQCEVLNASIVSVSSPSNGIFLKAITTDAIIAEFEFLDSNQGFKCEVLHTAPMDLFQIAGTIKGIGQPKDGENFSLISLPLILLQVLLLNASFIVLGIATALLITSPFPRDYQTLRGLVMIVFVLAFSVGGYVIRDKVDDYFSKRRPPGSLDF